MQLLPRARIQLGRLSFSKGNDLLPKHLTKSATRFFQELALIALSLLIGSWVYQETRQNAERHWIQSHRPGDLLWGTVLQSKNYSLLRSGSQIHRVIRSLPLDPDLENRIWISKNRYWVVLFLDSQVPEVYQRFKNAPQQDEWDSLPENWPGLEELIQLVKDLPIPEAPRRRIYGDPFAIEY